MFQSVLEQQEWRARRLGTGAGVSLLVHGGMIAVALIISTRVVPKEPEPEMKDPVILLTQLPPRGNPNPPTQQAAVQPKPKIKPKPQTLVQPTTIPQKPPVEVEPTPQTEPDEPEDSALPYDPNGKPDGITGGTCLACEAIKGATAPVVEPTGEDTVPFSMGTMTPPKLLSGTQIEYTREAREAQVRGLLIAKCTITREGDVENCRIIKGLPHMNEAVLSALENRRYTPVQYQGRPTGVTYIFNIKLDFPR
ncbi:energy transducer TonB [Hyalangium versicolor]|uniref:energy transducer TonB n=1 Tax=Hyalangium versicolor TaxID=2861190 RepID=UPI001CCE25AC|nr:energy transducer TonB [Hyalangium versicolor]